MTLGLTSFSQTENPCCQFGSEKHGRRVACRAFSLIEVIAVLAILGILAAAVLPVLIRQIDYASERVEATNLVALATGFTEATLRHRLVPGQGWDAFIATNIGWELTAVQTNSRHNRRVFLIDPTLVIGAATAGTLPYRQTASGSANPPTNPRFIILSSLSSPFPTGLISGVPPASDFNAVWNTANDTLPTGTSWNFSTWKGQPADLKIQRVNLASSFIHVILKDSDPFPPGAPYAPYSVTNDFSTPAITFVTPILPFDAYFLKGTILNLYFSTNANLTFSLEASHVLQQDTSLFFCNGLWRNAPCPIALSGLEGIVQTFYTNFPHSTGNPATVYNDMINYMTLYMQYAAGGFADPALRTLLETANASLNGHVQNLVQ